MRLFLAIILCKLTRRLLRLMGRGGTALPGSLALRLCPDLIARLSRGMRVALVTGTNGKTTTCRMLEQMLTDGGADCFADRSGSNLRQGIAAALASNAGLTGRPKRRTAVIECDEAAFSAAAGEIKPAVIVVTNLFRDQLDRYGEVTHTRELIARGVREAPEAVLCLNADCPLTSSIGDGLPNPRRFFGLDCALSGGGAVSDAPRCMFCGGEYEYDYRTFAHLGGWRCRGCGRARREPEAAVTALDAREDGSALTLRLDGAEYKAQLSLPGAHNAYNAAAALAAATALGLEPQGAVDSLGRIQSGFGRMERFSVEGQPVTVILVKNPAGCDRALEYLSGLAGDYAAAFYLSDGAADGRDVSWIWDAAFEGLISGGRAPSLLLAGGDRREDMRLRLKYAGAEEDAVELADMDAAALTARARRAGLPLYILPTYTAMLPLREQLARMTGRKEFWS